MQKVLIAAGAFVVGATLGMGVLAAAIVVFGLWQVHSQHTGLGTIAGGIGHWTVLVVPVAFGAVLAWLAVRRLNRIQG